MNKLNDQLYDLFEPCVRLLGYELVGAEYIQPLSLATHSRATLCIYIDAPGGITLGDCERVSHQVSPLLDVENPIPEAYHLEVSSPGAERPFFRPEQLERFIGQQIKVRMQPSLDGQTSLQGEFVAYRNGYVILDNGEKELNIPWNSIGRANLANNF